ncbi:esterase-like activity of phytase family protein [Stenotrophomonas humi]|uniref:esterase-like activity of phytase family protein n=1 Tax=Stenotrophomonas humi TaxID=405444 RepID=UPI000A8EC077|nr:esterase-like activity of phytase family protein [Stenotrophomonas humi]
MPLFATALLAAGLAGASFTTPHLVTQPPPRSLQINGQQYIDHGLVAAGSLPAATRDFLGDTFGSFSSLAVAPGSWTRDADGGYRGVLWTLPDRGRNDPGAGLFYDYPARLEKLQLHIAPGKNGTAGVVSLQVDGGLELRDFDGQPFTGADPGNASQVRHGIRLPVPRSGTGGGKISMDAESLQFTTDGHFYVGDEYAANVYYFSPDGHLQGVLVPPPAVQPMRDGQPDFGSLQPPRSGRRNNQGVEGMALSPDGTRLFVALQSALVQDSSSGGADGRINTRVLVYDVSLDPLPKQPLQHFVVQLPAYTAKGDGAGANRTAAQSELRALDTHRFLLLARDGNGLGSDKTWPAVFKSILLVDTDGASNLAGSAYETGTTSLLADPAHSMLKPGIIPARWSELLNLLDPSQLARVGLHLDSARHNDPQLFSEKWEAMDLQPALDPARPDDWLLLVGNDNDFIAHHCVMQGERCDSAFDNDNRVLVYRLTLPAAR